LHRARAWHHRFVTSADSERLARIAYEAYRDDHPASLPRWEDLTEQEQHAWWAVASVLAAPRDRTRTEGSPIPALVITCGDQDPRTFRKDFTAGRQGHLIIDDEFASNRHARFYNTRGLWYVEDVGSTNGTLLNGFRITAPQLLKKRDKINIGHTLVIVVSV
jgi:hypothetical protein